MFETIKQKLSDNQVQEIRESYYLKKAPLSKLSKEHTVSISTVYHVVRGEKRFSSIPFPETITAEIRENRKPANQSGKLTKTSFRPAYPTMEAQLRKAKKAEYNRRTRAKEGRIKNVYS